MMRHLFFLLALLPLAALGQEKDKKPHHFRVTGSVQSDILVPQRDDAIGTGELTDRFQTNTYVDLGVVSDHVDAGARFEFTQYPLPGFDANFKGYGVRHGFLRLHYTKWELTLGSFYEQFGSGFILRTYEERSLGIDNSLLGGRFVVRPLRGVTVKALAGAQRSYWNVNRTLVSGADVELGLDQWIRPLADSGTYVTLGASWVGKYQTGQFFLADPTHRINFPTTVNAFDVRARVQSHGFNILAEYAVKGQDPCLDNGYIFRQGHVAMLSASYSKSGLSVLAQAKRSDNMMFRSKRIFNPNAEMGANKLNHLPAFAMDHTYSLAALYPYATNPDGEWAFQAELGYKFRKGTPLGGRYGTSFKLNASYIRAIDKRLVDGGAKGTEGYESDFCTLGDEVYYHDVNLQFEKKFSRAFKLNLMYMNQRYNKRAVEGEGGMVHSNIFVAEGKYQFSRKVTLRAELQYLTTKQDEGDWAFALLECSFAPHWMLAASDQWNCGGTGNHYYQGNVTYSHGSHRLQVGYGRTRAGFNCSGGTCRWVPATKGLTASYNYNF